jgi:hypothetical protein
MEAMKFAELRHLDEIRGNYAVHDGIIQIKRYIRDNFSADCARINGSRCKGINYFSNFCR